MFFKLEKVIKLEAIWGLYPVLTYGNEYNFTSDKNKCKTAKLNFCEIKEIAVNLI